MDEKRKAAYRSIIYQFLLDVRTFPSPLLDDTQALMIGRFAGPVAYQLHNLALASVTDFNSFDEASFWGNIDAFNQRNPDTHISHYRKVFDRELANY
jgi:hypothetical protein